MRGMGEPALQLLRGASGALAAGALAKGVDFSTDGHGHEFVTYLAWYGAGAVFVIATTVLSIAIYKRHETEGSLQTANPCGDLQERRDRIRDHAQHLKWELEHFDIWWEAIGNTNFDGKLGEGPMRTTHTEAMQMLLFVFAKFFSAVWTYEVQCPRQARPRRKLMRRVRKVYDALGLDGGGDTDEVVNSDQLHELGERSTKNWGKAEAKPFSKVELEVAMTNDPDLSESLAPVRRLLLAAGPDTEARSRLRRTEKAAKRVTKRLL